MPLYTGHCDNCGFDPEQFLRKDSETTTLICARCNRQVTVRQVRDNSIEYKEKDFVVGILNHEKPSGD